MLVRALRPAASISIVLALAIGAFIFLGVKLPWPPSLPHADFPADVHTHTTLSSQTTSDGKYFHLDFRGHAALNPNIIPHPRLDDTWYMVAQKRGPLRLPGDDNELQTVFFQEIVCEATFQKDGLRCIDPPLSLPIPESPYSNCSRGLEFITYGVGPHDARVFYGPEVPYATYGSLSERTCLGQWIQDFRMLVDWGLKKYPDADQQLFRHGTDMHRPFPQGEVQKNFVVWWDVDGHMYVHYDVAPSRSFAKLLPDGTSSDDLAPLTSDSDNACLKRYLPTLPDLPPGSGNGESIHQSTNSLSITLCDRADPACIPDDDNTFIFMIFQHKKYYRFHAVYEPYVMMFRRHSPFEIHAISTRPLWVNGRKGVGESPMRSMVGNVPPGQTEMLYLSSMSWKDKELKYHGHADDTLFLAFGVEDSNAGAIDIKAADLVAGLGRCDSNAYTGFGSWRPL